MSSNIVYVIGYNQCGELAYNVTSDLHQLTLINHNHDFEEICCGRTYSIYCNYSKQQFFSAGSNQYGECCIGEYIDQILVLTKIKFFSTHNIIIKKVCVGICGSSTFWITNKNKFYANGFGKMLGLSNNETNRYEPILINQLDNIIDAKSGTTFSVALRSWNHLFIVNYWILKNILKKKKRYKKKKFIPDDIINLIVKFHGIRSEIYFTTNNCLNCWEEIKEFHDVPIIKIETGRDHALFLEEDGNVWAIGDNTYGQLGVNTPVINMNAVRITYFKDNNIKIIDISVGYYHNIAIDDKYNIYLWGRNNCGQCATSGFDFYPKPILMNLQLQGIYLDLQNTKIIDIKCGGFHSYFHTNDNRYYFWGSNKYRECLTLGSVAISKPVQFKISRNRKIQSIHLGNQNTKILVCKVNNKQSLLLYSNTIKKLSVKTNKLAKNRYTGICKRFNKNKGFGFILHDSKNIFVHRNDIKFNKNNIGKQLNPGLLLEFNIVINKKNNKQKAVNVTRPHGQFV